MTEDNFWQIVEESRERAGGVLSLQEGELAELLSLLPPVEIVSFQEQLDLAMLRSYRSELWAAAYIMGGGCSDDTFLDFRSCLIARGRKIFQRVLEDPEVLAELADPETAEEEWFYEGLLYVPNDVYEAQTHTPLPPSQIIMPELEGEAWDESEESLRTLLPRLFEKFEGKYWRG